MTTLAEVVAAHADCDPEGQQLGAAVTGMDSWSCGIVTPFRDHLDDARNDHLAAAVTAWIGERLSGSRPKVREQVAEALIEHGPSDVPDVAGYREATDAALAVVAAALGVEVGSGSTEVLRGAENGSDGRECGVLDFVQWIASNAAYNGAGDPGQSFYNDGLNAWLPKLAIEFLSDGGH